MSNINNPNSAPLMSNERHFAVTTFFFGGVVLTTILSVRAVISKTAIGMGMFTLGALASNTASIAASYTCNDLDTTDVESFGKNYRRLFSPIEEVVKKHAESMKIKPLCVPLYLGGMVMTSIVAVRASMAKTKLGKVGITLAACLSSTAASAATYTYNNKETIDLESFTSNYRRLFTPVEGIVDQLSSLNERCWNSFAAMLQEKE